MKKKLIVCLLLILVLALNVGFDFGLKKNEQEKVSSEDMAEGLYSEYYPVFIEFQYEENAILRKNVKLDIYIDNKKITSIEQGKELCYGMILTPGKHTIKVSSSIINSDSKEFEVGKLEFLGNDPNAPDLPNIVVAQLAFKQGDAKVKNVTNIKDIKYESLDDAFNDYASCVDAVLEDYEPYENFNEVYGLYDKKMKNGNASNN